MKIPQKRLAYLQLTLQVKEEKKHTKGPILGGEHDTFGSAGSHKWNVATLSDRTPKALEGLPPPQSVRLATQNKRFQDDALFRTEFKEVVHPKINKCSS